MFCETYNKSLTYAAASGELSLAQREHLASCEPCRITFAEEQSLFAAIDSGLSITANSEIPATLIPRVRVALNNDEPGPQRRSFTFLVWGLASAVVTAGVVFGLIRLSSKPALVEPSRPAPVAVVQNSPERTSLNPARAGGVSPLQHVKSVSLAASNSSTREFPEVIVPPDEGAALLRYEEFRRKNQDDVVLVASAKSLDLRPGIEPLQIAEIELVDLKIPVLSKWDPEDDTK